MDQTFTSDTAAYPRICLGQTQPAPVVPAGFDPLAAAFEAATGWVLRFDESRASRKRRREESDSIPVGKISICDMSAAWPAGKSTVSRQLCDQLAKRLSQVFEDLQNSLVKLSQDESTSVQCDLQSLPSVASLDTTSRTDNFAELVRGLLASCVQLSGADAAAVCLIDEESKQLTTRYTHSSSKFQGMVRSLSNCPADLEALCGSAVVMTTADSVKVWQCPFEGKSAICLPISSSTTLLGTLWVFAAEERDFDDDIVNVLEIISGRIAAEMELVVAWRDLLSEKAQLAIGEPEHRLAESAIVAKENSSGASDCCNEVPVLPPFDGWSVDKRSTSEFARWAVGCDELIVALIASGIDSHQRAVIEEALESASSQPGCDVFELLDSIRELCDMDRDSKSSIGCVAAVIDPLIGEVQLAQIGACCKATLSRRDGELQTIYRNHACFMTRGQKLTLTCGTDEISELVFHRSK